MSTTMKRTPYKNPDAALKKIFAAIKKEFNKHRLRNFLAFDEVNTVKLKKSNKVLFEKLENLNKSFYLKIAREVYAQAVKEVGGKSRRKIDEAWVMSVLNKVDPVAEYIYTDEAKRKRDRFYENLLVLLLSRYTSADVEQTYRRGVKFWQRQTEQFEINIVDRARRQAFIDNGIERFMWNTQQDNRVCAECKERDGQIYTTADLPVRHYNCRCWLSAV